MIGQTVGEVFVWIIVVLFIINLCRAIYETASEFDDIKRFKKLLRETAKFFRWLLGNRSTNSIVA